MEKKQELAEERKRNSKGRKEEALKHDIKAKRGGVRYLLLQFPTSE